MANPIYNKKVGNKFEITLVEFFRGLGHLAERLRLAGKDDEGDVVAVIAG